MLDPLIHFPAAAAALGFGDTRAVRVLCQRHRIPIVRLNKRDRAIRMSHYRLLLDRMSGFAEAA